jgi:hypothetical protein
MPDRVRTDREPGRVAGARMPDRAVCGSQAGSGNDAAHRSVIPATGSHHPNCISSFSLASQEPQPSAGWLSLIRT